MFENYTSSEYNFLRCREKLNSKSMRFILGKRVEHNTTLALMFYVHVMHDANKF